MHCRACGQRRLTTLLIQEAPSALTRVICAQRSSPSSSKKLSNVFSSRPAAAQISRPVSWSRTTIRYLCPLRQLTSSIPIRRSLANGSMLCRASLTTRVTIPPTLRQVTSISWATADFEVFVANQAT